MAKFSFKIYFSKFLIILENNIWQGVLHGIQQTEGKRHPHIRFKMYWAAASILVLFSIAAITWFKWSKKGAAATTGYAVSYVEKTTKPGEHIKLTLPDGSIVWLNGDSKLKYPNDFDVEKRELYLTGEAYFEVQHKIGSAFIVHVGDLATRDIGTAFNIQAYPNQSNASITVANGKVEVNDGGKKLGELSVKDQLNYQLAKKTATVKQVDVNKVLAWTKGNLIFNGEPFEEVANAIKQNYNIDVQLNNNVRHCNVYGAFSNNKMKENLQLIAESLNARVEKSANGRYVIIGGGCR